jgi:hypothetical protein
MILFLQLKLWLMDLFKSVSELGQLADLKLLPLLVLSLLDVAYLL